MSQRKPLNLALIGLAAVVVAIVAGLFYGYEKSLNVHENEQAEERRLLNHSQQQ